MANEPVLLVDHEEGRRERVADLLTSHALEVLQADSSEEALQIMESRLVQLVISETELPNKSGLFLLKEVKANFPDTEFILLTHDTSSYSLLQALRLGAYDCIVRPIDDGEILFSSVDRAMGQVLLKKQNARLINELEKRNASLQQNLAMMKALNESVEQLMVATGTQELLQALLASAAEETKAERGFIALFDKEDQLGIKISRGIDPNVCRLFSKKMPPGIFTQAAIQNKPALVPAELPPVWVNRANREELESLRVGPGLLMAPLKMKNRQAGIITVFGHSPDQPFGERDLLFLMQLSSHAALALTRESRIYHQSK